MDASEHTHTLFRTRAVTNLSCKATSVSPGSSVCAHLLSQPEQYHPRVAADGSRRQSPRRDKAAVPAYVKYALRFQSSILFHLHDKCYRKLRSQLTGDRVVSQVKGRMKKAVFWVCPVTDF